MAKLTSVSKVSHPPSLRGRPRARAAILMGAAVLVSTVLSMSERASALPGDTIRVSSESVSNSSAQKTATATCAAGRQLVGAGANINNGGPRVIIDEIVPNGSANTAPTAVTVKALEDEVGTAANWSITAYGICTQLPITDVVRVSATSAVNSNATRAAVASCPPSNRTLLGSGFDISSGNGQVNVHDLIPSLAGDGQLSARAHEDSTGLAGNWSLTAYAICGVVNGDMEIEDVAGGQTSVDKSATAHCADGYTLLSGGVDMLSTLDGAGAQFGHTNNRLVIDELRPTGSLFTTPRDVTITVLEASPSPEIWWPIVFAVCFDPA